MKLRATLVTPNGERTLTVEDVQRFMGADLLTEEEAARVVEIINADPDGAPGPLARRFTLEKATGNGRTLNAWHDFVGDLQGADQQYDCLDSVDLVKVLAVGEDGFDALVAEALCYSHPAGTTGSAVHRH